MLARNAGFSTSMIVRGTEGGVVPSLRQKSVYHFYKSPEDIDNSTEIDPINDLGISCDARAVPLPKSITKEDKKDKIETKVDPLEVAKESLKQGLEALSGKETIMSDCILLCSSIILSHLSSNNLESCSKEVNSILKSGSALRRFKKL